MFTYEDQKEPGSVAQRISDVPAAERPERLAREGMSGSPTQLPHLSTLEQSFGRDLKGVECYRGGAADRSCEALGANAFAHRGSVVLKSGRSNLGTVAEETAHVLQQKKPGGSAHDFGFLGAISDPFGSAELEAKSAANQVSAGMQVGQLSAPLASTSVAREGDWPRHPKKECRNALDAVRKAKGWFLTKAGHWGRLRAPNGASMSISGTPRNPGTHAKQITRFINNNS